MLRLALAAALTTALAAPAFAQSNENANPPPQGAAPASPVTDGGKTVSDPHLQVASVKLENGYRASKLIGSAVYNGQNQQIGTVDDIILDQQNHATLAVISVGGFLGVGGKLVALPYDSLNRDNQKVTIANADKNTLNNMPSFTFGQ